MTTGWGLTLFSQSLFISLLSNLSPSFFLSLSLSSPFTDSVQECPRNCHGNGECVSGVCHCFPGFHGMDCSKGRHADSHTQDSVQLGAVWRQNCDTWQFKANMSLSSPGEEDCSLINSLVTSLCNYSTCHCCYLYLSLSLPLTHSHTHPHDPLTCCYLLCYDVIHTVIYSAMTIRHTVIYSAMTSYILLFTLLWHHTYCYLLCYDIIHTVIYSAMTSYILLFTLLWHQTYCYLLCYDHQTYCYLLCYDVIHTVIYSAMNVRHTVISSAMTIRHTVISSAMTIRHTVI
jgi:hypothetical protein